MKPRSESLSSWQDVQLHDDFYDISEDFVTSEGAIKEKRVMKEEAMRKHVNCAWNPDFCHFDTGIQRLAVRYATFEEFIDMPPIMIEYRHLVGKTINVHNLNLTIRLMNGTQRGPSSRTSSASSTEEFVDAPSSVPELSMELKLTHCNVGLELFEQSQLSSRLRVTVKELQVLDHIETSTWTKFMTSAIPPSNKRPRETDRDMIKLELSVRENEHALRVSLCFAVAWKYLTT
jgi:hypothetical protein